MKKKNPKILSVILVCCIAFLLFADIKAAHADESQEQLQTQQNAQAKPTLSIDYKESGVEEKRPLSITLKIGEKDGELAEQQYEGTPVEISSGKRVVIHATTSKGRKATWKADVTGNKKNIFSIGENADETKTIEEINGNSEPVQTISFVMPSDSLTISITEQNHILRILNNESSELEEPYKIISSKKGVLLSELKNNIYKLTNGMREKVSEEISWEIKDPEIAIIKDDSIKPLKTGKSGTVKSALIIKDRDENIAVWGIDINYSYNKITPKDAEVKIYDHKGAAIVPDLSSGQSDTYDIAFSDKVTVHANTPEGKLLNGWTLTTSNTPTDPMVQDLKILNEDGEPSDTRIVDFKGESFSFLMPENQSGLTLVISAEFIPVPTGLVAAPPTSKEAKDATITAKEKNIEAALTENFQEPIIKSGVDSNMITGLEGGKTYYVRLSGQEKGISVQVPSYQRKKFRVTASAEVEKMADIKIEPASEVLEEDLVTITVTPKDPKKLVKSIEITKAAEKEILNPVNSVFSFLMPATDVSIASVELQDKPKSLNPPQSGGNNNHSDGASNSNESSSSDANSGSGSGSVKRITPKDNKKEVPKKESEQKNDQNALQNTEVKIEKVFQDVTSKDWFAESVAFVKKNNLMQGTGEKEFSPNRSTSRAMLVTILHRLVGTPSANEKSNFMDVKGDEYFAKAIDWAIKNNIVKGYEDKSFRANDDITREQVAVILYNYAKTTTLSLTEQADLSKFKDVSEISSYATEALKWANAQGLILGKGEHLDPKGKATRAEIATIIMRFHSKLK